MESIAFLLHKRAIFSLPYLTTFYYLLPHFTITFFICWTSNWIDFIISSKVVISRVDSSKKLFLFLSYFVFLIFSSSLISYPLKIQIFFVFFVIHVIISLYVLYSIFEIYILHEKQGSKLSLSKEKITSNDWS